MRRSSPLLLACALVSASTFMLPSTEALVPAGSPRAIALQEPQAATVDAQQKTDSGSSSIAEIDEETARALVRGCTLPREVKSSPGAISSQVVVQLSVSNEGKLLTAHRVEGPFTHQIGALLATCHFKPYKVNDVKTAFRTNITFAVK